MSKLDWNRDPTPPDAARFRKPDPSMISDSRDRQIHQAIIKKRSAARERAKAEAKRDAMLSCISKERNEWQKVWNERGEAAANNFVHKRAIKLIDHARAHGDTRLILPMVMSLPEPKRRQMKSWLSRFTPLRVRWDERQYRGYKHWLGKKAPFKMRRLRPLPENVVGEKTDCREYRMAEAEQMPFYRLPLPPGT